MGDYVKTTPPTLDQILEERGKRYGDFADKAVTIQAMKGVMRASPNWNHLTAAQRESLEMVAHKIGRILHGDPNYKDSWTDIAGFVKLIEMHL